jgi:tripartite-type tricarboxylate transporter receptor subunit TctC
MQRCLALLLLIATALMSVDAARAQSTYPTRPVRIICGFPAGTSLDIITRIYAQKLEERLGQPFVVENRAGASGNLAAETASRSVSDGYTLLSDGITQAISMSLFRSINFDIVKDFEPIGFLGNAPNILVVNASLGVNSVAELITLAKSRPGDLTYGTAGVGTAPHMAGELFNLMTGAKLMHVPYRGTNQAVIDLIGGRLSLMFSPAPTIVPHLNESKLKVLATTAARRSSLVPDLPPLAEAGLPGFDNSIWYALWAPKGTPQEIVKTINAALVDAAARDDVKRQLATNGADPMVASPAEFGTYVQEEVKKWAKVIEFAGTRLD